MSRRVNQVRWFPVVAACIMALPAAAQQRIVSAADYARAERAGNASPALTALAAAGQVTPTWLANDRFWYRTSQGQFVLVDPAKKTKLPAFDHVKVAAAMSKASGRSIDAQHLPFTTIAFTKDMKSIMVADSGKEWSCDVKGSRCVVLAPGAVAAAAAPTEAGGGGGRGAGRGAGGGRGGAGGNAATSSHGEPVNMAPDARHGVFIHNWNLWSKDVTTGQEKQLTTDGVENFGYATNNAGWVDGPQAIGLWSADSKMIATQQQDQRNVGLMYLVSTPTGGNFSSRVAGHPVLRAWPYPLPGDSIVTTIQRVVINVETGKMVRFQMPPDQHRSTIVDNLNMGDIKWSPDDGQVAFASVSRDHKHVWLRVADANTGVVRTVFDETSPTQFESSQGREILWRILWSSNEVIWFSERDGWGQLYLYDLGTGKLKNKITSGEGLVTSITRINDTTRTMWFTATGREAGQNPYYPHFYRIGLDGTHLASFTPDEGYHVTQNSPSGKYLIDTWSQTDVPAASALRDATTGALVMPLEKGADPAALKAAGWNPVATIKMKGRDGKTDIYGVMYKPSNFDPSKKYPIINNIYPGPQQGSNSQWGFIPAGGESQGLAELGFIVVKINGMGTPGRSKAFHDAYYANMGDNTLPDQVAGMKELAQRFSWIDIDKVGIWGHSGGGYATAGAMFHYPDFFKVGIAESGNHDNREYEDDWAERYQGLDMKGGDPKASYDSAANQNFAKNLKGHLMLAHGTMDNNVPPYNTLLIVDQLIKANKDFDLLLIPNSGHGYPAPANTYMQRRRWDYFTRWLLGAEPPKDYEMGTQGGGRGGRGRGTAPPAGGGLN